MINYDILAFPKPKKISKKKILSIKPGKKTTDWANARKALKIQFQNDGIDRCEIHLPGCWVEHGLSFAHVDKRRNLKEGELFEVVLACVPCHQIVERMEHTEMRAKLESIIRRRNALKGGE